MKDLFFLPVVCLISLNVFSVRTQAQWVQTNGPYGGNVYSFAANGTNLFAGTYAGVFLSTNNGTNWTPASAGLTNPYLRSFGVSPNGAGSAHLLAGTASPPGLLNGIFRSTNNGESWSMVLPSPGVNAFAVYDTNPFAGADNGVFVSTNHGTSWTAANSGLTSTAIYSFAVSGTSLFAGTVGSGVWRRPLSEMITSVQHISPELPTRFALRQNYPNPFNPSTTLSFNIPHSSFVILKVYNILGQEVRTLVNEKKDAGAHMVRFNAEGLPSGVYVYRIESAGHVASRKMLLLK